MEPCETETLAEVLGDTLISLVLVPFVGPTVTPVKSGSAGTVKKQLDLLCPPPLFLCLPITIYAFTCKKIAHVPLCSKSYMLEGRGPDPDNR